MNNTTFTFTQAYPSILTENHEVDNISIAKTSSVETTIGSYAKTGYSFIGITQVRLLNATNSGSGYTSCAFNGFYISSGLVKVRVYNFGSAAAKIKLSILFAYQSQI